MSSRCKSAGCKKWVVVGVKYCKEHAAEAVPAAVRKVSLAGITLLSDTSTAARSVSDTRQHIGNGGTDKSSSTSVGTSMVSATEPLHEVKVPSTKAEVPLVQVLMVQVLLAFMSATNFGNWTRNKKGWEELADGMSDEEAAACKPAGVTFDGNWKITAIWLDNSGLTGIRTRMMALQYRQIVVPSP